MLNMKLADAYVFLSLQKGKYDSDMATVRRQLDNLPKRISINVEMRMQGVQTAARMIQTLRANASSPITFRAQFRVDRNFAVALSGVRSVMKGLTRPVVIPIRADARAFFSVAIRVQNMLATLRRGLVVNVLFNGAQPAGLLRFLQDQMREMHRMSRFNLHATRSGGWGMGGGGGGYGGGGFLGGALQGAGLHVGGSPLHVAGQFAGQAAVGSISTAAGIQSEVADIRRISGFDAGQGQHLKSSLLKMGTEQSGVSTADLFDISKVGARMGVADKGGVDGLVQFTRQIARVKNAITDIPTEQLANQMGRVLNVFDLGTERVEGFGSALTKMDNISTASASDILQISTGLSGTARSIGITLPQLVAFSSVLKDVGLTNQLAAGSFSQIFRKMGSDSAKFAASIGVDAETFANAYRRDPMEALGMVIKRFNEMKDTVAGQEFLKELGLQGVRTAGSLQQLATKFDLVAERAKTASEETASLNALTEANDLKAQTLSASFQKLQNAVVSLADALASPLIPALTKATTELTRMANATKKDGVRGYLGENARGMAEMADMIMPPMDLGGGGKRPSWTALVDSLLGTSKEKTIDNATVGIGGAIAKNKPGAGLPDKPDGNVKKDAGGIPLARFWRAALDTKDRVGDQVSFRAGVARRVAGFQLGNLRKEGQNLLKAAHDNPNRAQNTAAALRDLATRQKEFRTDFLKRAVPAAQRAELGRRLGQGPTDEDRRLRPVFAQALEVGRERMQKFASERQGILAAGQSGERPHYQSGLSGMDAMKRMQDDVLNSKKDDRTAKAAETTAGVITRIEGILKNLKGQFLPGVLS